MEKEMIINVPLKTSVQEWLVGKADERGRATCREAAKIIEDAKLKEERKLARASRQ